jgi:hypothetical protein
MIMTDFDGDVIVRTKEEIERYEKGTLSAFPSR